MLNTPGVRVVLDTQVWVSAMINPAGEPAQVVNAITSGAAVAVVTPLLLDELAEVMRSYRQLLRPRFEPALVAAGTTTFAHALTQTLDTHIELITDQDPPRGGQVRENTHRHLARLAHTTSAVIVTGNDELLDADLTPPATTPHDLIERICRP